MLPVQVGHDLTVTVVCFGGAQRGSMTGGAGQDQTATTVGCQARRSTRPGQVDFSR